MKIEDMISAVQSALGVAVDGRAGPETWCAIYARIVSKTTTRRPQAPTIAAVDAISEKVIGTLLTEVQPIARALVQKAAFDEIQIKIVSGLRSYADQDALYKQGRTAPGKIVTNAKAGYSNHNFGIAFDVGVFEGKRYLPESPKYKAIGALGKDLGLEWGGNWMTIVDEPHFQLRPAWAADMTEKAMLAELRNRISNGTPVFA